MTAAQQDVPLSGEWVATTDGFVNAQIQPQVSGYLVRQNYKEGSIVHKSQVLFEIDPRPLEAILDQAKASVVQAKAAVLQAQAQLDLQSINVKRDTPLAAGKAIAQSQLDTEVQTQHADQAAVAAAEAQVQAGEAQVRSAELNFGFTHVRSIIDGVAGLATVQVGNLVGPSAVLTTVSQLNPIKVYFAISEQEYLALSSRAKQRGASDLLASGNTIPLHLTLANGDSYPQTGHIIIVDRSISAQTGSIRMVASFPNPNGLLRPGQFGRIKAETDIRAGAIVIPQRAVNELQGLSQVVTLGPADVAHVKTVMLGPQVGAHDIIILSGIGAGDRVVTEGLDKIKDGMKISPQTGNTVNTPAAGQNQKGN
jgi:membrane fusion protein (multidrug efflux system)